MNSSSLIVDWYAERLDDDNGEILYEAHGPRESFITFQGPNAKQDCAVFMKAVNGSMCE